MDIGAPRLDAEIAPMPLSPALTARQARIKRMEDVIIASLLIVIFCWMLLGIAFAVKLSSRGPVLFRQERRGHLNKNFGCLKFRSMYHDRTDPDCAEQTAKDDPRVTRVGRFLRKRSLDELPQLFNVIAGDMSLVGPRPHALGTALNGVLLPDAHPKYILRYRTRPGITGWAQVNGWRGNLDSEHKLEQRVAHDLHYIENWSLTFDLKILLRTFTCMMADERAY